MPAAPCSNDQSCGCMTGRWSSALHYPISVRMPCRRCRVESCLCTTDSSDLAGAQISKQALHDTGPYLHAPLQAVLVADFTRFVDDGMQTR